MDSRSLTENLITAALTGQASEVEKLLAQGLDVHARATVYNFHGYNLLLTPTLAALAGGHTALVETLIKAGGRIDDDALESYGFGRHDVVQLAIIARSIPALEWLAFSQKLYLYSLDNYRWTYNINEETEKEFCAQFNELFNRHESQKAAKRLQQELVEAKKAEEITLFLNDAEKLREIPKTNLYKITSDEQKEPCYLYGLIHYTNNNPALENLSPEASAALDGCDVLVTEVNVDEALDSIPSSENQAAVPFHFRGGPRSVLQFMPPIMQSQPLPEDPENLRIRDVLIKALKRLRGLGMEGARTEKKLWQRLKPLKKENEGLVTINEQLEDLECGNLTSEQQHLVAKALLEKMNTLSDEQYAAEITGIIEKYLAGDHLALRQHTFAPEPTDTEEVRLAKTLAFQALMEKREIKWLDRLDALFKSNKSIFAAVGGTHICGLVLLLTRRGYRIEPINEGPRIYPIQDREQFLSRVRGMTLFSTRNLPIDLKPSFIKLTDLPESEKAQWRAQAAAWIEKKWGYMRNYPGLEKRVAWLENHLEDYLFYACYQGRPVGIFALLPKTWQVNDKEKVYELYSVFIEDNFRHYKLGSQLLTEAKRLAFEQHGATLVVFDIVEPLERFYNHNGAVSVCESQFTVKNDGKTAAFPSTVMRMRP